MSVQILIGDVRAKLAGLPDESVHCAVTSPPYFGLRDYGTASWEGGDPECDHMTPRSRGHDIREGDKQKTNAGSRPNTQRICANCGATRQDNQIGLEATPEGHIKALVDVFREVRRVLRKDGVLWLNYGDAYAGGGGFSADAPSSTESKSGKYGLTGALKAGGIKATAQFKAKDLLMMPARVALALQADGWWLRSMMPWVKRSAMPESVTDRPATAIEYVFLLTKSPRYFFDMEAVRQSSSPTSHGSPNINPGWKQEAVGNNQGGALGKWTAEDKANGRNFRNSDLFYASLAPPHGLIGCEDGPLALDVNPAGFSEAHFATFPPKLIEPLIKAGTSEKGVCADCGAPWVREVETSQVPTQATNGPEKQELVGGWDRSKWPRTAKEAKTTGWSPSCDCNAAVVPATVLDPFGGAGTSGLVADRLGRSAILIELNKSYAAMARRRIDQDGATRGTGPAEVMRGDDLPLFEDVT